MVQSQADDQEWLQLDGERVEPDPESPSEPAQRPAIAPKQESPSRSTQPQSSETSQSVTISSINPTAPKSADRAGGKRSLFDDDLPELAPLVEEATAKAFASETYDRTSAATTSKNKSIAGKIDSDSASGRKTSPSQQPKDNTVRSQSPNIESIDSDIRLAPLEPRPNSQSPLLVGSLEELMLQSQTAEQPPPEPVEEEFAFPCKVCGTRLYAHRSRVGTKTRCPDCFSEFLVPNVAPRKKQSRVEIDPAVAHVTLAPVDAKSSRSDEGAKSQSAQILEKAREEAQREREELESITTPFDSQRWFSLVFWFCRDPLVNIVMLLQGIICAVWLAAVALAPSVFEVTGVVAAIVQAFVFLIPFVFIVPVLLILGMTLLTTVANQHTRIQTWPFQNPGDSFGELVTLLAALVLSSIPGGMVGIGISSMLGNQIGTAFFTLSSICVLLPFFLLSMADNNSLMEPFSKPVFESLKSKSDAWGAMYLQTMFAIAILFCFTAWAMRPGIVGEFLLGIFLPFLCYFVFNQYGVLAGRISGVTQLGFSGDFSEDDAE